MNIEKLYDYDTRRFLTDLMIEDGNTVSVVTHTGVRMTLHDVNGALRIAVKLPNREPNLRAAEFLRERYPGADSAPEVIRWVAAPAFYKALASDRAFAQYEAKLRAEMVAAEKRKAEEERLARVKRLLTPEQEAQIATAFRGIEEACVRGGGWIDECISTSVGEVAVDTFRAMGYMEIAGMFERFIPYRLKNRKPVVTPKGKS